MASVKFQDRGRKSFVPLSLYAPLRVLDDKPLFKVLANDAVPQGFAGVTKDQQIGYWNEQVRWRMRRGERVELPSNWHFYYLGTGPHAKVSFRKRTEGVFWVALAGSKADATGLPTRKPSVKPIEPDFKSGLPSNVEVVEPTTPQNSRPNSRSRSRGPQSRSNSNNRENVPAQSNKKQSQNNQSRNSSKSRNQSSERSTSREDLIDAVKEALKSLGIGTNQQEKQDKPQGKNAAKSGKNTPKGKSRSNSKQRQEQKEKPEWRRVPFGDENVEVCFGPRGGFRNFGDEDMVKNGVKTSGYAQLAGLAPNTSALLFGGNVAVRELSDEYEFTYTYKMTVSKDEPHLAQFLEQVDAYKTGSAKPQRTRKNKRNKSPAPVNRSESETQTEPEQPIYDDVGLPETDDGSVTVEMIDEVFDSASTSSA
uniref:Nucleoprotein n=1 Tax=Bat Coronavirus MaJX20 TaxID=3018845 RepID=A0AA49EDC2_9NIDO|nr:nucleocapsid phosphoprotein [Bat Coronavirus MaJX20]